MRFRSALAGLFVVGLALAGCGSDDPPDVPDGSIDGGDSDGAVPIVVAEPTPPTPPNLLPCPDGWREMSASGALDVPTCEPWPASGRADCADGEAHFPGEAGCVSVAGPCPASGWPDDLPAGALHVRATAAGVPDGSAAAPYPTVASALAAAPADPVIALYAEALPEALSLPAGATVIGACADSRIEPTDAMAAVTVGDGMVTLRNLTVAGAGAGLVATGSTASVVLSGVVIAPAGVAVSASDGARIEGDGVAVISPDATGAPAAGLTADGATIELRRAVLDGFVTHRIEGTGAALSLDGVAVLRTLSDGQRLGGSVHGGDGASITVTGSVFEDNRDKALRVDGADTTLTVTESVFRDTESRASDGAFGVAIGVLTGASATIERCLFERNRTAGVAVQQLGSALTMTDVVLRDHRSQEFDGQFGRGIDVDLGATLELSRAQFLRNRSDGIHIGGPTTHATITDVVVAGTRGRAIDDVAGFGIWIDGGIVEAERIVLDDNRLSAMWLVSFGTSPSALSPGPADPIELTLIDATLVRTRSNLADGFMGSGIVAAGDVSIDLSRTRIEDNQAIGLWLIGPDVATSATDFTVAGVAFADCVDDACADRPGGFGAAAFEGSSLMLTDFHVSDTDLCGLSVDAASSLDLERGLVTRNAIGVNVQATDYDLGRLQNDVVYRDNDTNLDSATLAAPAVVTPGL